MSYQVVFILNFIVCYGVMKALSWWATPSPTRDPNFFFSPYLSQRSLRFRPRQEPQKAFPVFLVFSILTGTSIVLAREFLLPLTFAKTILIAPLIYFFTEAAGALGQLIFSFAAIETFPIHFEPYLAKSLSQFWGRRWNLWVQDWLKDINSFFSRKPRFERITVTFILSGVFHELLVNLPYYLVYHRSYFGTMMAYFLIQGAALWVEKRFLVHTEAGLKRCFLWTMIFLPSPLFINVPLLTFFGIIHG